MNLIKRLQYWMKKKGSDKPISISAVILCIFGVIMIGDASVGMAITRGDNYAIMNMVKQVVFLFGGGACYFWAQRSFKLRLRRETLMRVFYTVVGLMLICRLWNINGSHAWIKIGSFTVQPSEFMKIVLILIFSDLYGTRLISIQKRRDQKLARAKDAPKSVRRKIKSDAFDQVLKKVVGFSFIIFGIVFLLCAAYQGDLGSSLIMVGICLTIAFATPDRSLKRIKKVVIGLILVALAGVFILTKTGGAGILKPHQIARFITWLDPLNDQYIYGTSYQIVNGMVGYTNGGLIGRGFGNSVMKYGYIPEAQNDYISAIIAEEFGLLGMVLLLIPYCLIIFRLIKYANEMESKRAKLILVGISAYFFFHVLVNLGGVSGLIPMTGVPLLLVSAGGTSTVAALLSLGIAQNLISRHNKKLMQSAAQEELENDL